MQDQPPDEEARKRSERANARYETGLSVHVAPWTERYAAAQSYAVSYAQFALKTALLLNGGALVVYPAFITSTRLDSVIAHSVWSIAAPSILHAVGLLQAVVAIVLGFFVMTREMRIVEATQAGIQDDLRTRFLYEAGSLKITPEFTAERRERQSETDQQVSRFRRSAYWLEIFAIGLFAGSIVCFIGGAGIATYALTLAGPLHLPFW